VDLPAFTVTGTQPGDVAIHEAFVPAETIRNRGYSDLASVARVVPGLTAAYGPRGGPRNERRLYLRGFDSRQLLLLVDGIPFYIPYDGEPGDFERFQLWNAETVEISKGISSVLYGPNAMGGAINIATAPPTRSFESETLIEGVLDRRGEAQQWNAFTRGGFIQGDLYGQFGASSLERDFWTLPDDFHPEGPPVLDPGSPGNLEDGGEREQSRLIDRSGFARLGWTPGEKTRLSASFFHQQAEKEVPPYAGPPNPFERVNFFRWSQWDRTGVFVHLDSEPVKAHRLRVRLYYDAFANRLERFDDWTYSSQSTPRSFSSGYDDHSLGGSAQWEWRSRPGESWTGVVHYRWDDHQETANLLPDRRTPTYTFIDQTTSVGLERRRAHDSGWKTVAGLSLDHRDPRKAEDGQRGGESFRLKSSREWNAVFSVEIPTTEQFSLTGGIARKSRLPSMIDRYSYRQGRSVPNPELEAETALNTELGGRWSGENLRLEATVFHSRVDDLMQNVVIGENPDVPGRLVSQTRNVGTADFTGLEVSASWTAGRLRFGLDYTFTELDPGETDGLVFVGVPDHEANLYLAFSPLRKLELIPSIHLASERLSSEFGDGDPVDGFAVGSLRALFNWSEALRLELTIENVTDEHYRYDHGYPEPGRFFKFALRWRK
jgi:iron complex outermembrane receptor protein